MVCELCALMPGMEFSTVMDFYWDEFSYWHEKAVNVAKRIRGVS